MSEVKTPLIECRLCKIKWNADQFDINPRRPKQMLKACRICHSQHKCQECNKGFSTKSGLNRHYTSVHTNIKNFQCKLCGLKYTAKTTLSRHVKSVHEQIKNFHCELCNYKCSAKATLKQHIRALHDKIKDIQCPSCEQSFSYKPHLTRHIRAVHDKIRDVQCPTCEYKCSHNSQLKKHIKAVHDKILDFQCPTCEYKCSANSTLTQHIKAVHDKIRDFQCPTCEYNCAARSDIKKHMHICTGGRIGSSGEVAIKIALEAMRIDYEYNTAHVVKDIGFLRWDFIIKHEGTLVFIEYDGTQHFEPVRFGGMSAEDAEARFVKQQLRDKMKDDYCNENKYALLRIPHYDFGLIPQILTEFMIDNIGWGAEHKKPDE